MIGIVDVEVQAANPQMPLCPFVTFVGSPSSVRVRNVPGNIGSWNITKVYVSANYPDNSIQSRECIRVGEIYVGTLPACDTAGKGANGFVVSADGVDESGNAVTGYVLGKGDLEILDADGAITPGVTTHYVHGLDEQPSDPHEYDIYKDGDTWKIYFNGAWEPFAAPPTLDDAVTPTSGNGVKSSGIWSAIWGALSALPAGFTSLYDWCVAQLAGKASKSDVDPLLFAQYYPDGSVKSAAEFTPNIKYDDPDTINRTITVKPFCNSGTAANDNSGLEGRVVIPPFVDAQGNGYLSDDGTRFKVVGVSGGGNASNQSNLSAIVAPCTVTTVGNRAFISCSSLTTVSLPAVTGVGENAFFYCSNLTSVTLPAAMTVGLGAFINCSALTSVTLPVVTNIENGAFINCSSLASVDFGDTSRPDVPMLGTSALGGVPTTCKIIVPYTQYDAWIAADGWKDLPQEFVRHAEKADKPTTFTTGNLAKFDTNGNPVDSEKKPSDFQSALSAQQLANIAAVPNKADVSAIPYSLVTKTISNGAVSLDDRAINAVAVSSSLASLTVNFPTATSGKVRDFGLRLTVASGITTAPELALPQGVTCENADGTAPEIGADGAATILYFTETASGVFLVKGEVVTAIS